MHPSRVRCYLAVSAPFVAGIFGSLSAQTAPPKPSDSTTEAAIALDPFTVSGERDVGYVATNTLAGSRLNTALKDTPASISVLTSEFLSDIGAFELESAMNYAANVQSDRSEEGQAGNRLVEFYNSYRVRGILASVGRNFFVWNLPTDSYNVERIDQSRGPNSILFGVGSPGGIINSSTKQPVTGRKFENVGLVVGRYDFYRGTLDVNQPLLNGKAGVRVNMVWDDHKSFRHFEYNKIQAAHLSAKWNPWPRTTLRAEGEVGYLEDNHARNWTALDRVSIWNGAGRPTLAVPAANAAQGIARYATATPRVTYIDNTGQLFDVKGAMLTATPAAPNNQNVILDRSVADYTINPGGAGAIRTTDFSTYTGMIEQRIGEKTFLELAYNHQAYEFVGYDADTTAHMLYGDPNRTLPTGATNSFAGRYFVESNWYRRLRTETIHNFRLTGSTAFDFGRLGAYRLAALAERQNNEFQRDERREFWAGAPFGGAPEAAQNLVFHRTYVTEGDWGTYGLGGGKGHLITGMVDPVNNRTLTSSWIQRNTNTDDDPSHLTSLLAGAEARYFGGRLVALGGVRHDRLHNENRGTKRDPVTQEIVVDYGNVDISDFSYNTSSYGAVLHALPWLSISYNRSKNTSLPNIAHRILPNDARASGARARGEDVGFTLSLPNNRAYFKATYYTIDSVGQTDFKNMSTIVNRNDNVLDALLAARVISAADAASHRTVASAAEFGRSGDGYEFEIVANPTTQWRLSANYTRSHLVESNIGDEVVAWAAGTTAYWRQFNPTIVTSTGETVGSQIANLAADLQTLTGTNGVGAIGNRRDKLSLFTRYSFVGGRLQGAFVGGGYRYQSGRVAGRGAGNALLYGNSLTGVDAVLGYRRKVFTNHLLTLQLNVTNVFDFDTPQTTIMGATGTIQRFELVAPRDFRLSARMEF